VEIDVHGREYGHFSSEDFVEYKMFVISLELELDEMN